MQKDWGRVRESEETERKASRSPATRGGLWQELSTLDRVAAGMAAAAGAVG